MAASKLTFDTKVENGGTTPEGKLSATEANDIKTAFNANADLIDAMAEFKTSIPVTADKVITWQTDLVPGDTRTFAQKHGNKIGNLEGVYLDGGIMNSYKPNYSYTFSEGLIQVLTIQIFKMTEDTTGFLTII